MTFESRLDKGTACVIIQSPNFFGIVEDAKKAAAMAHAAGALLVFTFTEAASLGILEPPRDADIVAGELQSFAISPSYGGPFAGIMAAKEKYVRQLPGRLVGESKDSEGNRAFCLTLATREQHIRREKATSNICTNSGLCTLAFTVHLSLLGEEGFSRLARLNHAKASALADRLSAIPGVELVTPAFFNEFPLKLPKAAAPLVDALANKGVIAGVPASRLMPHEKVADNLLIVAATETATDDDFAAFERALKEVL